MEWLSLFVGFFLGLISSVWTNLVWERYDRTYNEPVREFLNIRQRIVASLEMYAYCYANPGFVPIDRTPIVDTEHLVASQEFRVLASELAAVISTIPSKPNEDKRSRLSLGSHWKRFKVEQISREMPPIGDMLDVQKSLMGLSNGLFLSAGVREDMHSQGERNMGVAAEVKQKLGLRV